MIVLLSNRKNYLTTIDVFFIRAEEKKEQKARKDRQKLRNYDLVKEDTLNASAIVKY